MKAKNQPKPTVLRLLPGRLEGGVGSTDLFQRPVMSKGKNSIDMVCSIACKENIGNKRPGDFGAVGTAQKKK
jgi:hypothetical protein